MSGVVLYYNALIKLCDDAAKFTGVHYLYLDLMGDMPPSPGSYCTLARYYGGDIDKLRTRYKKLRNACKNDFSQLCKTMEALGIQDADVNGALFKKSLVQPKETCDFRACVRKWARAELYRIEQEKEPRLYNYGNLLDRYEALLLKRRNRKR
jgi:hypothetical protein